jgi:hypothetical protein
MPGIVNPAQIAAQPVTNTSTVAGSAVSDALSAAATNGAVRIATYDEILFQPVFFGTLTNDCTLVIEISINGTTFGPLANASWTNAELASNTAKLIKLSAGVTYRPKLNVGTMSGSNGITLRHKN